MLLAAKTMAATTLISSLIQGYCKNANKSISKLRHATVSLPYPEKSDTVTFKIQQQRKHNKRGMPMSMSSIPSPPNPGSSMAGSKELVTRFPTFFALYLFDYRTHGDDGNFVAFGVSAKNPTDGTPVVVKNLSVWKDYTGFYPMLLKTLAVCSTWRDPGAGFRCRSGGARRLLPALMVKMASHVNARYAS